MIIAYCDHCGIAIDAKVAGGTRYVLGKKEWSGHLCQAHQDALEATLARFHETHALRVVKA